VIKVNGSRNGRFNNRLNNRFYSCGNDRLNNGHRNVNNGDRLYRNDRLYNSDIRLCNIMCYLENTWLLYRWRRRR
jgi:hypothetical protein